MKTTRIYIPALSLADQAIDGLSRAIDSMMDNNIHIETEVEESLFEDGCCIIVRSNNSEALIRAEAYIRGFCDAVRNPEPAR